MNAIDASDLATSLALLQEKNRVEREIVGSAEAQGLKALDVVGVEGDSSSEQQEECGALPPPPPMVLCSSSGNLAAAQGGALPAHTMRLPTGEVHAYKSVCDADVFQRIPLGLSLEGFNSEEFSVASMLWEALELREKHWVCRKLDYYMGACTAEEYKEWLPPPPPPKSRDVGIPLALLHDNSSTFPGGESGGGLPSSHPHHDLVSGGSAGGYSSSSSSLGGAGASAGNLFPRSPVRQGLRSTTGDGLPAPPSPMSPSKHNPAQDPHFHPKGETAPTPSAKPFTPPVLAPSGHTVEMVEGVFRVYMPKIGGEGGRCGESKAYSPTLPGLPGILDGASSSSSGGGSEGSSSSSSNSSGSGGREIFPTPGRPWEEFVQAYTRLSEIVHSPAVKTFSYNRLQLLEMRFNLHRRLNGRREYAEQKMVPHRDFYNCRKVDTHVHHSACMSQKHLMRFIIGKLETEKDTEVIHRDGKVHTLGSVFESLNIGAYDLSINTLDMHADMTTMHRFDRFNRKYSPMGQSRLREIFLKTSNMMGGRYLAEITKEVCRDLEEEKYQYAEYRLSVYGSSKGEWGKLAKWVVDKVGHTSHVRWMVQCPRLYADFKEKSVVANFGEVLSNFFEPLFAVTIDPSIDPTLHDMLTHFSGVDLVDDESKVEESLPLSSLPPPELWTSPNNPPYAYWCYYFATNLAALNALRGARGLTQLSFRPHCGEAGDENHLVAAYLTAEHINHGIVLRSVPGLEYIYYLSQIGLAMSPLSNNMLFLEYEDNPMPSFYARGLNVSLSTDDPLIFHHTKNPLLEEYAVASQVYRLSPADLAEIARNSVLQSGFEYPFKAHWIGRNYAIPGPIGNNVKRTNLPHIRLQYRLETLREELCLLKNGTHVFRGTPSMATAFPSFYQAARSDEEKKLFILPSHKHR